MTLLQKIAEAQSYIEQEISNKATVGIILGTGLGQLTNALSIEKEIPYEAIPHFVTPTAEFHRGKLIYGTLQGVPVLCLSGRFHRYEGYSLDQITFPVRLLKALGCTTLCVSNVAGALNPKHNLGDIMIINDHINLLGDNPLIGKNEDSLGPRWPDMIEPYQQTLIEKGLAIAKKHEIPVQQGVYACMSGPSLETRAEYKMLSLLGADAIGMSTVPEVIVAVHAGLQVFACSILTDLCYEGALEPVDISRIIQVASEVEPKLVTLFSELIAQL